MQLLVLGGSGRTGRHLLEQAPLRGHHVRALVRDPSIVPAPAGVELIKGTPARIEDLRETAHGADAVLFALNNSRESDNLWAKPVSPPGFMTDAARDMLRVMDEQGLQRIVVVSAIGAGDSWQTVPFLFRALVKLSNVNKGYVDHHGMDRVIQASTKDWTLVRATALSDKPLKGELQTTEVGGKKPGGMAVARSEVARFMLDAVEQGTWIRRAPILWNGKA